MISSVVTFGFAPGTGLVTFGFEATSANVVGARPGVAATAILATGGTSRVGSVGLRSGGSAAPRMMSRPTASAGSNPGIAASNKLFARPSTAGGLKSGATATRVVLARPSAAGGGKSGLATTARIFARPTASGGLKGAAAGTISLATGGTSRGGLSGLQAGGSATVRVIVRPAASGGLKGAAVGSVTLATGGTSRVGLSGLRPGGSATSRVIVRPAASGGGRSGLVATTTIYARPSAAAGLRPGLAAANKLFAIIFASAGTRSGLAATSKISFGVRATVGIRPGLGSTAAFVATGVITGPIIVQGIGNGPAMVTQGWRSGLVPPPYTGLIYRLYVNDGAGGPVDYATPWTVTPNFQEMTETLAPGVWKFAVRTYDTFTGLEDKNVDAVVEILVAADLADVSSMPPAPTSLLAIPRAGGDVVVSWRAPLAGVDRARYPTGFRVYRGTTTVDYATSAETVYANAAIGGLYSATLGPLADGVSYKFGVRAFNDTAEESNTAYVAATALATGPTAVVGLTATAVAEPGA